jgi:hypothetical protein
MVSPGMIMFVFTSARTADLPRLSTLSSGLRVGLLAGPAPDGPFDNRAAEGAAFKAMPGQQGVCTKEFQSPLAVSPAAHPDEAQSVRVDAASEQSSKASNEKTTGKEPAAAQAQASSCPGMPGQEEAVPTGKCPTDTAVLQSQGTLPISDDALVFTIQQPHASAAGPPKGVPSPVPKQASHATDKPRLVPSVSGADMHASCCC